MASSRSSAPASRPTSSRSTTPEPMPAPSWPNCSRSPARRSTGRSSGQADGAATLPSRYLAAAATFLNGTPRCGETRGGGRAASLPPSISLPPDRRPDPSRTGTTSAPVKLSVVRVDGVTATGPQARKAPDVRRSRRLRGARTVAAPRTLDIIRSAMTRSPRCSRGVPTESPFDGSHRPLQPSTGSRLAGFSLHAEPHLFVPGRVSPVGGLP